MFRVRIYLGACVSECGLSVLDQNLYFYDNYILIKSTLRCGNVGHCECVRLCIIWIYCLSLFFLSSIFFFENVTETDNVITTEVRISQYENCLYIYIYSWVDMFSFGSHF